MQRIEYILKHNVLIQKSYIITFSFFFKFLGLFIRPDKKRIFFQSLIGKTFGDSPKVLFDKIRIDQRFKDFNYIWAFEDPDKFIVEGAKKVKLNSLRYYIESLRSGIWITNVNVERGLKYKPKSIISLNTWHGIPIKVIGNAQKTRNDYNYSNVDFMCCSCDYEYEIFIRDFNIHCEAIVKCGMPRNDELYRVDPARVADLRKKFKIPDGKKVIFYAPTWRDSADGGGSYQIAPPIDIALWERMLGADYTMIIRMHHLTTKMLGIEFNEFARDCSHETSINELMILADILISDYSATIFDFSILEKPIISFAYDYVDYSANRGFYKELDTILPHDVCKTQEEVIEHILHINYALECDRAKDIKRRYIETSGNATETCMAYLIKQSGQGKIADAGVPL